MMIIESRAAALRACAIFFDMKSTSGPKPTFRLALLALGVAASSLAQGAAPSLGGGSLRNLATLHEGVKRQRISSYDRTGGNRDHLGNIDGKDNYLIMDATGRGDDYSSVAYWYQAEPHKKFPPLPAAVDRLPIDRWKAEPVK